METAEQYALPVDGELGLPFLRWNEFNELFPLRWGRVRFDAFRGQDLNIKVLLKVYRSDAVCEQYMVDTYPYDVEWNRHKRATLDFYIHPFPSKLGRVTCVKFSYVVHVHGRSVNSASEYIFMEGHCFDDERHHHCQITSKWATPNSYRTFEVHADTLQRDVDWYNNNFDALRLTPKFTKGQPSHPYHPKRFIHDHIDKVIRRLWEQPGQRQSIKVAVDCIDDGDFINHLIHASDCGVVVQCVVDWRKMALTNSDNYVRLKRSRIELLGVFCTPRDPLIEVAPDMHTKFIVFGDNDCLQGSFNITFDRWWANWESGMTFHSQGVCRLFDNIFQSLRGGVIQRYGIDPMAHFNLLYTFGRHHMLNGRNYRPHQMIIAEICRARHSIRACLFIIGEMRGDHNDSVIDALVHAKHRGVDVQIILNGHMVRQGDPAREYTMAEELRRPLLPSVSRLRQAGVGLHFAYGQIDQRVPYCPLHSKYCVIDERIVMDGSFNWYNTSVFSHDQLVVAASAEVASAYLHEFEQIRRVFRFPA